MTPLRPAQPGDADAIAALDERIFGPVAWSQIVVAGALDTVDGSRYAVVAVNGPSLVGYGFVSVVGDVGDVQRLAVDPSSQRRGVGGSLLDRMLLECADRGVERVLLEVAEDNPAAQALYAAHNFSEIARRPRYYCGRVDAIVMARRLRSVACGGGEVRAKA